MVRLREIPRPATFAWSTGSAPPLLATGTRAGAVDADFSNETQLELWDLDLDNPGQDAELQPSGSIGADSRFHDIAWGQPNDDHPRGIIAGALESGSLDLWDAEKLRTGASDSFLSRTSTHTAAIKSLQFNPFRHEILATSGGKGELYINDLNVEGKSERLGTTAARADDFDTLDWNKMVPHIMATGSSGGFVTIWDVKNKKESLTLNNSGRKAVSAVVWNPNVQTKLVTAIPNDQDPLILVWDLRNANAPERVLRGHDQGVLSLSWCSQDNELLLSCGKDNRTICWNPLSGEMLGEFPVVTNWTFQTRWNQQNPTLLATASFDGKIAVQSTQSIRSADDQADAAAAQSVDGDDFFSKVQSQPQGADFSLPKAPKWMRCPVGVSFGFGGKLVKLGPTEKGSARSKIDISTFVIDSHVGEATEKFEKALAEGNLSGFCESKIAESTTDEEKADWTVMEKLISGNPRRKLVEYLGFDDADETPAEPQPDAVAENDDEAFFDEAGSGDTFLSDLAASKSTKSNNPFKIYSGSESEADTTITRALMLGSFEKALDVCLKEDRLSDAFMIAICGGQKCIDKAQAAYFRRKTGGPNYLRLLASVVGKNLWDVVHNADLANWKEVMATLCTFADQNEFPDLCEALGDRLEELVQDESASSETRKNATFCYLAGSKLEKVVGNWAEELDENERQGLEQAESDNSFSVHARYLQDYIEKVTIFRQVTKFEDTDSGDESGWKLAPLYARYTEYADVAAAHGQLNIAEKYLDLLPQKYPAAEIAKNRVKQATRKAAPAQPQAAPAAAQRSQRTVPSYGGAQPSTAQKPPSGTPYAPPNAHAPPQQASAGSYAPPGGRSYTPAGPYAPAGYQQPGQQAGGSGGFQPQGYNQPSGGYGPQSGGYGQPSGGYGQPSAGYGPPSAVPPPPRGFSSSPSVPPPSQAASMSAWNDIPDFGNKPVSRRGTPGAGPNTVSSPFPNQPAGPSGLSGAPYGQPHASPPPLAPPPKGPPRMTSPQSAGAPPMSQPERPSSSAANAYAPPQPQHSLSSGPPSATIPRGTSPYNPPPSGAPPSNRYAPAPGSQPPPSQPGGGAPPPSRHMAPPSNPYAQQGGSFGQASQAPPPQQFGHPPPPPGSAQSGPPPSGPPRAGPPPGGPLSGAPPRGPSQGPPAAQGAPTSRPGTGQSRQSSPAPPPKRHPPGDRSHIPDAARPVFDILSTDMQRVKSRAPPNFKAQVADTEKRLNILFDLLNNGEARADVVQQLGELAGALQAREYEAAQSILTALMTGGAGEGSQWMVGVKRLIAMSRATPQ